MLALPIPLRTKILMKLPSSSSSTNQTKNHPDSTTTAVSYGTVPLVAEAEGEIPVAHVVQGVLPAIVKVEAPSDLPGGYELRVQVLGQFVVVTVVRYVWSVYVCIVVSE